MSGTVRFASFLHRGVAKFGREASGGLVDLTRHFGSRWPSLQAVVAEGALPELIAASQGMTADIAHAEAQFLPPIGAPGKIICVGVNYPDRNAEYKDGAEAPSFPSLFIRFPQSFVGHGVPLVRPKASRQFDYEGEIALVIGKAGRHIDRDHARGHIAGLTLCNEGTLRDWVRHAKFNVTQGKNFDSSGSLGPWLVPYKERDQLDDIRLITRVNGETRQDDRTSRMIFDFDYLISYISTFTTLAPGDVIVTGTPTGAGARREPPVYLQPGDVIEVEAEGLGILRNPVVDEA
jgi:2-keto-4-pentenoate hydratase/2-oxohepta-3-ene-1,7-dioic acid hydratase in catechol pathway